MKLETLQARAEPPADTSPSRRSRLGARLAIVLIGAAGWWLLYRSLDALAKWFTYELLKMAASSRTNGNKR